MLSPTAMFTMLELVFSKLCWIRFRYRYCK